MKVETTDALPVATLAKSDWMDAAAASTYLGISRKTLAELGDKRVLTRRMIPGAIPRYLRADVVRLAERYTTAAIESEPNPAA